MRLKTAREWRFICVWKNTIYTHCIIIYSNILYDLIFRLNIRILYNLQITRRRHSNLRADCPVSLTNTVFCNRPTVRYEITFVLKECADDGVSCKGKEHVLREFKTRHIYTTEGHNVTFHIVLYWDLLLKGLI